ncbi:DUF2513 domain-containing protein [Pacificimonas sp. ICDLI1SI03]|mgnify:CR=1 FL=1|jgi:hypothetical protein|tara:strand:- start:1408 stop:1788 length:381 start_codon:yes stop_codon:yes gene_type:complete
MKLDKDLVRDILLAVEADTDHPYKFFSLDFEGHSKREIAYHVMQLHEAGFLEAANLCHSGADGFDWQPKHLTYRGHEFLDSIRDPEIWQRTKSGAEKAGGASVGFLWDLAKAYGKHLAAERLGIPI